MCPYRPDDLVFGDRMQRSTINAYPLLIRPLTGDEGGAGGKVSRFQVNEVTIKPLSDCQVKHQPGGAGASGAVRAKITSRAPAALHVAAQSCGDALAFTIPIHTVFKEMELQ